MGQKITSLEMSLLPWIAHINATNQSTSEILIRTYDKCMNECMNSFLIFSEFLDG